MKCPRCADATLGEFERDGIRVDACPQCRGVWLDRGELEQLVARGRKHHDEEGDEDGSRHGDHKHHDHHDQHGRHEGHKRLKSRRWLESLGDLFD